MLLPSPQADPTLRYGPPEFTALYNASLNGHAELVELLCSTPGVDVGALTVDGVSPLYAACQNGHAACVEVLLSANTMTSDVLELALPAKHGGHRALHVASQSGHPEVVQMLLSRAKVSVEPRTTDDGTTPLMLALYMAGRGSGPWHMLCVQWLLRAGASLQTTDAAGKVALEYCPREWQDAVHTAQVEYAEGELSGGPDWLLQATGKWRGTASPTPDTLEHRPGACERLGGAFKGVACAPCLG